MQATIGNECIVLKEAELCPPLSACPFCKGTDSSSELQLQLSPKVTLMTCARCHLSYANRMPTPQAIDAYYARYYNITKIRGLSQAVHFSHPERLARHLHLYSSLVTAPLLRIVDFGGGDGTVSLLLAKRLITAGTKKVEIVLVDYETSRISTDARIYIRNESDVKNLEPSMFDFVIASASLEHVPALLDTIAALIASMKPGARLYVRTPYVVPLIHFAQHFGVRIELGYPAHLYDLGVKFWNEFPQNLPIKDTMRVLVSRPAIVETTFTSAPFRTLVAHLFKMPWYLLGERYNLVGGWEVVMERA